MQSWSRNRKLFRMMLLIALVGARDVALAASPAEQSLYEKTNQARADQRLAPLQWNEALARAARVHAAFMVKNSELSHQYPGEPSVASRAAQAGAHFQSIAENIARGPGVNSIQDQWMKSMPHRTNILDPNLNSIGFAVVESGDGLYAVADFGHSVPSLTLDQVEAAVARLLAAQEVEVTGPRQDARQTCEMNHGTAGASSPTFVVRWQSSDMSQLPASLVRQLQISHQRTAAVGACASGNAESGFTAYRVAVLLY